MLSFAELRDSIQPAFSILTNSVSDTLESLGGIWEAPIEATLLMELSLRHAQSIITLQPGGPSHLPTAVASGRAAFEAGTRSLWLVVPQSRYEAEARWLAHVMTHSKALDRLGKLSDKLGQDGEAERHQAKQIADFCAAVQRKLPEEVDVPAIPNFRSLLIDLGLEAEYRLYILLSNHIHATHLAPSGSRSGLGTMKSFGDFSSPEDWAATLLLAWKPLARAAAQLLTSYSSDADQIEFLQLLQSDPVLRENSGVKLGS